MGIWHMKTGKRILAAGLAVAFVVSGLAGCGSKEKEHIELSLWSDERNMPLLEERAIISTVTTLRILMLIPVDISIQYATAPAIPFPKVGSFVVFN